MTNVTVLVGRLTKKPELKYTQSGLAVCNFTLAVNRTFANQNGQREADFISCVCWKKVAENLVNYMDKGSQVSVTGRIQTRTWDDDSGKRNYVTEVVAGDIQFLESKKSSADNGYQQQNNYAPPQQNNYTPPQQNDDPFNGGGGPIEVTDEDLPF